MTRAPALAEVEHQEAVEGDLPDVVRHVEDPLRTVQDLSDPLDVVDHEAVLDLLLEHAPDLIRAEAVAGPHRAEVEVVPGHRPEAEPTKAFALRESPNLPLDLHSDLDAETIARLPEFQERHFDPRDVLEDAVHAGDVETRLASIRESTVEECERLLDRLAPDPLVESEEFQRSDEVVEHTGGGRRLRFSRVGSPRTETVQ